VCAGAALVFCTACNLASPVMTGLLFETLVGRQPLARYPRYLALLAVMYVAEPLVTRVYIRNACAAGEKARPWRSRGGVGSRQGPRCQAWSRARTPAARAPLKSKARSGARVPLAPPASPAHAGLAKEKDATGRGRRTQLFVVPRNADACMPFLGRPVRTAGGVCVRRRRRARLPTKPAQTAARRRRRRAGHVS